MTRAKRVKAQVAAQQAIIDHWLRSRVRAFESPGGGHIQLTTIGSRRLSLLHLYQAGHPRYPVGGSVADGMGRSGGGCRRDD